MSGRLPIVDDAAAISARLAELRAERARSIAKCPPQPEPPSQIKLALEAMARARARLRQAGVPIREEDFAAAADRYVDHLERAIAAKAARHRVLT